MEIRSVIRAMIENELKSVVKEILPTLITEVLTEEVASALSINTNQLNDQFKTKVKIGQQWIGKNRNHINGRVIRIKRIDENGIHPEILKNGNGSSYSRTHYMSFNALYQNYDLLPENTVVEPDRPKPARVNARSSGVKIGQVWEGKSWTNHCAGRTIKIQEIQRGFVIPEVIKSPGATRPTTKRISIKRLITHYTLIPN